MALSFPTPMSPPLNTAGLLDVLRVASAGASSRSPLALLLYRVMLTPPFLGFSASDFTTNRRFACLGLHRVDGSTWFTCLGLFREKRRGGPLCASFEHQIFWKNAVKVIYVMRM